MQCLHFIQEPMFLVELKGEWVLLCLVCLICKMLKDGPRIGK